jgi:hypothetical protein
VFICCFIVALLLLRHDDLITFTRSLGRSPFVIVAKALFPVAISIMDAHVSTKIKFGALPLALMTIPVT